MDRRNRDLMQIQFLILQMERQLVIITAMIDRLRRRWGLQRGQRRPRRYWVRPWLSQSECEEEGQYTRLMPMLELHDPMGYRNFIRMPPELFQELEQRFGPEIQKERTRMRSMDSLCGPVWITSPSPDYLSSPNSLFKKK